jgi:hypothetical protein
MFMCPVCFFENMPDPPAHYNICPCCGTEFENDDEFRTHAQLRDYWISKGAKWFFNDPPPMWNAWEQLTRASVPLPFTVQIALVGTSPQGNSLQVLIPDWGTRYTDELGIAA